MHVVAFAQVGEGGDEGGADDCAISINYDIQCDKIEVRLRAVGGANSWPTFQWDFGDGSPIVSGGTDFKTVFHTYTDVNPYFDPITVRLRMDDASPWCERIVEFPGVFIGSGCGSTRKVSQLVADGIFPPNSMADIKLYIFGNLEVDISYRFDNCDVFVGSGGKIVLTQNCILFDVVNNTVMDAHTVAGNFPCIQIWYGIEMQPGSALETNGATIRNAYFAISSSHGTWGFPVPSMLGLVNTTFERNFIGIHLANGQLAINKFINNTFAGLHDQQIHQIGTCGTAPPVVPSVPYAQRTYCGIYFDGSFELWGNAYLSLPGGSFGNVFKDLQAGIVALNGTTNIRGCRFENIRKLLNNTAAHQATAITFIDNIGGSIHRLVVDGLGKNSTATVHNAERGIYALTSQPMTQVHIADCRMTEIQNGVLLDEGAQGTMGNFDDVDIRNNYVGSTNYPHTPCPEIGAPPPMPSTGIEVKDPNTLYSSIDIVNNEVNVDQPEAFAAYNPIDCPISYISGVNPTAIRVTAMQPQAPSNSMDMQIGGNVITMPRGLHGIEVFNASNASIYDNTVDTDFDFYNLSHPQIGIWVEGGADNLLRCNSVRESFPSAPNVNTSYLVGLRIVGSLNTSTDGNSVFNAFFGILYQDDNSSECYIGANDIESDENEGGTLGLFYANAQTGPQYLTGNEWIGQFLVDGAGFNRLPGGYSYCNSLYTVSPVANIGPGSQNSVYQEMQENCNGTPTDWFTVTNATEENYGCNASRPASLVSINATDLDLADGGTDNLSAGFRWSTESWLYQKFSDHPSLTAAQSVATAFVQANNGQPVAQMKGVRGGLASPSSAISAATTSTLNDLAAQLRTKDSLMTAALGSTPINWTAWDNLNMEVTSLTQDLVAQLGQAASQVAAQASSTLSANGNINCTALPCTYERYLNDLYLSTRVTAPRMLTPSEVAALHDIAVQCPSEAGPAVYLARSWYHLLTGQSLSDSCSISMLSGVSQRTSLDKVPQVVTILVSPNPADQSVQLTLPPHLNTVILTVRDRLGRTMMQQSFGPVQSSAEISLSQWATGCYSAMLTDEAGKPIGTARIIVAH